MALVVATGSRTEVGRIAGLTEGVITTGTRIQCTGTFRKYEDTGYAPKCWIASSGATHGNDNVTEAIRDSCNIFFYTVGDSLPIDTLARYAAAFGLGEHTGIELPEAREAAGKPRTGRLTLSAQHQGGNILIDVIDDGAGLDRDKLLAAQMSEEEMREWIGVNSLAFVSLDGLYRAAGEARGRDKSCPQYCDACFSGEYPVAPFDQLERGFRMKSDIEPAPVTGHAAE